jgi:hypothetical protein
MNGGAVLGEPAENPLLGRFVFLRPLKPRTPARIAAIEAAGEKLDKAGGGALHHQVLQQVGSCNLEETAGSPANLLILQKIG